MLLAAHQLTGTALAWWENNCAAADDATTITWEEFMEEFHHYHIPAATMKCKKSHQMGSRAPHTLGPGRSTLLRVPNPVGTRVGRSACQSI